MATNDVLSSLQTVNATITGVTSAPTDFPAVLNSSDLPMALSYPEAAEYGRYAREGLSESRSWFVRLYVQPISQGRGVDEGFGNSVVFIDRFRDEWEKTTNQQGGDWWSEVELVSDSGVRADMRLHNVGETLYWGIEFALRVIIHHDVDG